MMFVDLLFVEDYTHRRVLAKELERLLHDNSVAGVLLTGSLARNDALPGSDVDLQIVLNDGLTEAFVSEIKSGIVVERKAASFEDAMNRLLRNSMEIYSYTDGRILYDPEGKLANLQDTARRLFADYRTPANTRRNVLYSAQSTLIKLANAVQAGDLLKAAYVATTVSWPIIEGLWAASDRPLPPNSSVWPHLHDLGDDSAQIESWLRSLFLGDSDERVGAAFILTQYIIERLENPKRSDGE